MAEKKSRASVEKQVRGRYRTIHMKMWADEKFRALSPIPPSGQSLWVYLLTGPHTGPIPGLFEAGRAAMAETLGWDQHSFDKALGEVLREGLIEADWKARIVWIPKAVEYNKPQSPNVVLSWANDWLLLPECDLKWKAQEALRGFVGGLGEAYAEAFRQAFGSHSRKPSGTSRACAKQEQEQEQEQEVNTSGSNERSGSIPTGAHACESGDARSVRDAEQPGSEQSEIRPAMLSAAMRRFSVSASPSDPRIIAAAENGITPATIEAACVEAKEANTTGRVTAGYVLSIAHRWTDDAARMHDNGGRHRASGKRALPFDERSKDRKRAYEALTGQRVTDDSPPDDVIDVQAREVRHAAIPKH